MTTFMNVFVRSSQNFCGEWSKTYTFEHELPAEWPSKANLLSISYFKRFLKLKIKFGPVKMFERAKLYQIGVENCWRLGLSTVHGLIPWFLDSRSFLVDFVWLELDTFLLHHYCGGVLVLYRRDSALSWHGHLNVTQIRKQLRERYTCRSLIWIVSD